MKNKEFGDVSPEEAPLEYLQNIIRSAPEEIAREYAATKNTWMDCFVTILTVIKGRMALHGDKLQEILSPEGYQTALKKLQALEEQVAKLRRQYPQKEPDPPVETKEELLSKANIFE